MTGKTVTDKGFTSTALQKSSIRGYDRGQSTYINKTGGRSSNSVVHYHIETPSGKGIGGLVLGPKSKASGRYMYTPEFIFNRGSQFTITGAYEKNGVVHCNLRYAGNARK